MSSPRDAAGAPDGGGGGEINLARDKVVRSASYGQLPRVPDRPQSCRSPQSIRPRRHAARGRRNRPMDRPERPDQPKSESIFSRPDPLKNPRRHDLSRISRRPRSIPSTCRRGGRRLSRLRRPTAAGQATGQAGRRRSLFAADARWPRVGGCDRPRPYRLHRVLDLRRRGRAAAAGGDVSLTPTASPSAEPTTAATPEQRHRRSRHRSRHRLARRSSSRWAIGPR